MPRIFMSIVPDENGRDGPFACTLEASADVSNINDMAILAGNFFRAFTPSIQEIRIYPKGSGVYFSSNGVGVMKDAEAEDAEPKQVH